MYSTEQTEASTNENYNGWLALGIVFLTVGVTFLVTSSVSPWISWVLLV